MLSIFLSACVLVAITMAVHAGGITVMLQGLRRFHAAPPTRVWPVIRVLLRMIWWLILLHLAEISVWGLFYLWRGCLPDAEAAFYFSAGTYTTVGSGGMVLAKPWRLLGSIEALTGVLMCGLSTGYFFVVVSYIHQSWNVKATAISTTERTEQ